MYRIHSDSPLGTENLLRVFFIEDLQRVCKDRIIPEISYGHKTVWRSSVNRPTEKTYLLKKTVLVSFLNGRTPEALKLTKYLPRVFYGQKTFRGSSMAEESLLLYEESLCSSTRKDSASLRGEPLLLYEKSIYSSTRKATAPLRG